MKKDKVKAVILAAGKGTRMKSDLPKVLHPIYSKPLLGYVLDAVSSTGLIDESVVVVGHGAEEVEKFVTEYTDDAKCVLQSPQRGTGDAVAKAKDILADFKGTVLVICGDTPLIEAETLIDFITTHKNNGSALTVMSAIFDNPTNYGRIVRNPDNSLKCITEEKDASPQVKQIKEINAGIYCLEKELIFPLFNELKCNNAQGEYYLTDIIAASIEKGLKADAYILKNNEEIFGINSKINLAEATKILNKRTNLKLMTEGVTIVDPETSYISPETTIGKDTTIFPNVYISGKNTIGSHCKIGPFAHIRDGAQIGDNVRIGNFVEVKKSVIKSNTNVSHLSYIGDSELGEHVNIGAGTITANYDPVLKTKTKTIIKDGANTGSNSVLVAPVTMHENSMCAAGSVITKDVEANALALTRSPLRVFQDWVTARLNRGKSGEK
ncbi:MAG: NTP transferase domain-containing protein [Candidatus Gastranaerophilales bacterium]|nr:NTP transferase domain-containing protein [Candidatus Gastranaerophilales bacterium]